MTPSFTRLDDFRLHSMNIEMECSNCGHRGVVDGPKLWRWFALHRWDSALAKISEHMRCSICLRRPTSFTPTAAEPTMDFGPRDEAGWKQIVRRLR